MSPQRVIVTGAFGGLGSAVAEAFLARGCKVAALDRALPHTPPDRMACFAGFDLADPAGARRSFDAAEEELGGVDVLVNVAGGFRFETLAEGAGDTWDSLFAMNLKTCLHMSRLALQRLSPGGAIVNVGAAAAAHAGAGMAPYAASKSAVARLTESLAAELGGRIRVNAVAPAIIDTPQNRAEMPDADVRRWTRPEAIADVIVFLASPAARAINGAVVPVTNAA